MEAISRTSESQQRHSVLEPVNVAAIKHHLRVSAKVWQGRRMSFQITAEFQMCSMAHHKP